MDYHSVALSGVTQQGDQLEAMGVLATDLVGEHLVESQAVQLANGVLVLPAGVGVAEAVGGFRGTPVRLGA
ncbi:hypothetical protein GCM10010840_16270 [Deinococcus aerolatus]|uniref:Uncharacterized protein n=1 Tax=Deinococcus aerolatus TaxID=522487 RepID=A0ABQ2G7J3_9DEIO|nr:hypothetical protein GCM10010840_16270 [Deinococcus aerolatus]